MSGVISLSEAPRAAAHHAIRAEGRLVAHCVRVGSRTVLADLRESGGYRLKFPRGAGCEAIIVNTGGGVAAGDDLAFRFSCGTGAHVTVTSQAAEKLYRCDGPPVTMAVDLTVADDAHLHWIPQETILFDGAHLQRRFTLDLATRAQAVIYESVVFGRLAMGECLTHGALRDSWRLSIAGDIVYADETRLTGDLGALLARPGTFGGAKACATLLAVGGDLVSLRDGMRAIAQESVGTGVEIGCSVIGRVLVCRMLAHDPVALRRVAERLLTLARGAPLPRVFTF